MRISAWDTGKRTGIALWEDGVIWSHDALREETEDLMCEVIPSSDLVIVEKLVISQATIKKTRDIQPAIEMVGLARFLARRYRKEFVEQTPADMKRFGLPKLERINWLPERGAASGDHQRDARAHILTILAERRLIDLATLLPT